MLIGAENLLALQTQHSPTPHTRLRCQDATPAQPGFDGFQLRRHRVTAAQPLRVFTRGDERGAPGQHFTTPAIEPVGGFMHRSQ